MLQVIQLFMWSILKGHKEGLSYMYMHFAAAAGLHTMFAGMIQSPYM